MTSKSEDPKQSGLPGLLTQAAGQIVAVGRKTRELTEAALRGEVRLQNPLVRTQPSDAKRRQRLEAEYDRLRQLQADLHRRMEEIRREIR